MTNLIHPFIDLCFQFCTPISGAPYYRCVCRTGYRLTDSNQCLLDPPKNVLLFGQERPGLIRGIQPNPANSEVGTIYLIWIMDIYSKIFFSIIYKLSLIFHFLLYWLFQCGRKMHVPHTQKSRSIWKNPNTNVESPTHFFTYSSDLVKRFWDVLKACGTF